MAKIQELLHGRNERIDYDDIIEKHPWIVQTNQQCIISPDSDGLLCGLFMSHILNWQIKGFYDGKVMVLEEGISAEDCIFLDMEIFRRNIRSVGHHMILYNVNDRPNTWDNFDNCIQPNILRGYDYLHTFRLKYPLATIHLLLGIVSSDAKVEILESAIFPLLFTDGTYQVLFKYPENVLNWLNYLRADEFQSPLKAVFENDDFSVFRLMHAMDEFFRERDKISIPKERGDRLRISDTKGEPYNIVASNTGHQLNCNALERITRFIQMLSQLTQWSYTPDKWAWSNWKLYKFKKQALSKLNTQKYKNLIKRRPLSWAITAGQRLEYTIEKPDTID